MITRSRRKADENPVGRIPVSTMVQSGSRPRKISNQLSIDTGQQEVSKLVQNGLILDVVTSYLSLSDLKQFRLVSRQCNRESLRVIRKRVGTINLIPAYDGIVDTILRRLRLDDSLDEKAAKKLAYNLSQDKLLKNAVKYGKDLFRLIQKSRMGFPCAKFGLSTELLQVNKRLFYNLLETVSTFATKLELYVDDENVYSVDMGHRQFPNLRALKMSQTLFDEIKNEETLKCFQHIINNAPVLDKLTLEINNDSEQRVGEFLGAINSCPIRGQLRTLCIWSHILDENLLALSEMGLRLQKLSLEFSNGYEARPESVVNFLESQSATLEDLTLKTWGFDNSQFLLTLPCMQKLSVLNLQYPTDFSKGSFSRMLPTPKRLVVGYQFEKLLPKLLNDKMEPMNTVEMLAIPVALDNFEIMNQVARIFPGVKELECAAPQKEGRTVDNGLNNLETLILYADLDDTYVRRQQEQSYNELMTGYSTSELKKNEKSWRATGKLREKKNRRPAEILQNLKVLRTHEGKFGDVFCLLGPMKLRSLQCLDLRKTKNSKVSQRVLDQMREEFQVLIENDCVIPNEQNGV